jgi:hypothetical protein
MMTALANDVPRPEVQIPERFRCCLQIELTLTARRDYAKSGCTALL